MAVYHRPQFSRQTPMVRRCTVGTALILLAALSSKSPFSQTALGQDRNPLLGTWSLNFAKSTFTGEPLYLRVTCKIEPWERDGLNVIYDMVGTRGGVTHWEWTGRWDGKDYALEGVEEVVTNAYSRIGDHTYSVVVKVDGRITTTTRIAISPDGTTMTATSTAS